MTTIDRPPAVRLDDLGAPRFSPEAEGIMAAVGAMAESLPFTPDGLCEQAAAETGLDDFGADDFRERLDVLVGALHTDVELSPMGRVGACGQLVGHLRNRVLFEDLWRAHPEIADVAVERPVVIAGLPRTGTTHLHNLLSADPGLRHLPYWESLQPVLPDDERRAVAAGGADPRPERTAVSLGALDVLMPHFKRMHEMTVDHAHEEIQLLAMDLSTMLFETMAPMPTWRDFYKAHDQTPHYAYLKRVLQALTWLRPEAGSRWVLKSPQHLEQLGPIMAVFPDATVAVTHRDPVAVSVSVSTMIAYSARTSLASVDPEAIGAYWTDRMQDKLLTALRDRGLVPAAQSIDVHFTEFMADDVGMVERIYEVAGQPVTAEARAAIEAYNATHPRGRHGGVIYEPDVLGIDVVARRAAFRPYVERFGVLEEPGGA